MEILLGMMGAGLGLGLYFAGKEAGKRTVPTTAAGKRAEEGAEAFRFLQNYNAEQAYGLGSGVVK